MIVSWPHGGAPISTQNSKYARSRQLTNATAVPTFTNSVYKTLEKNCHELQLGYIRLRVVQVVYELKTKMEESAQSILIPIY